MSKFNKSDYLIGYSLDPYGDDFHKKEQYKKN